MTETAAAAVTMQWDADNRALVDDGRSSRRDACHSVNRDQDILSPNNPSSKESQGEEHLLHVGWRNFFPLS
jgi:hypothetical protein